jgi:hypothetical protein
MTITQQASALAAKQAAQTIAYPDAHKDNATYIRYLTIKDLEGPRDDVASVLDQITSGIPRKKSQDQKKIRDAARMVLANLVHCIYQRKWLALPTKPEMYNKGGYLHDQIYLSHRPTMAVLERLRVMDWLLPAVSGNNMQHTSTMHCPTPELEREIFQWLYLVRKPFTDEYIFASHPNEENGGKRKVYLGAGASSHDLKNMKAINDHLREQSYALHGPQQLIYLEEPDMPLQGGRVYMDMQRLPDKKAKVRLNTLINGKPVVEIDLKANHLRMAAALVKQELPPDPYLEIVKTTGFGRDVVKSAINRSLGSDHAGRVIFGAADKNNEIVIEKETFLAIMAETQKIYPFVPFNKGLGVMLQSLEGQIMISAQLRLIELGITALPIHDALMVNTGLMTEMAAEQVLKECWADELEVDFFPELSKDRVQSSSLPLFDN